MIDLSRREAQIVEVIHRRGEATAAEVREGLSDPPSYSSVRALLRILEDKGHVTHEEVGPRYVFRTAVSKKRARSAELRRFVDTFCGGSAEELVAALLDSHSPSGKERKAMMELIANVKKRGR